MPIIEQHKNESWDFATRQRTEQIVDVDVTVDVNTATLKSEVAANIATLLASVTALNNITALTNATINANPAATIKDVARETKTVARQAIRIARLLVGQLDTTDSGS